VQLFKRIATNFREIILIAPRTLGRSSPHHGGRTLNGSSPHSLRPTAGACIDELAERLQLANGERETLLSTDAAGSSANQW